MADVRSGPGVDRAAPMTPNEVGQRIGRSPRWVRKACRRGELPHSRKGQRYEIDREAFERMVTEGVIRLSEMPVRAALTSLTLNELAEARGCSYAWVWERREEIPGARQRPNGVWEVDREAVKNWDARPTRSSARSSEILRPAYRLGRRPANAGRKFPAEVLSAREIARLLDACGGGSFRVRNRALIVLLWRSGLRVAEAMALEPKDVDRELGTVTVLSGKGAKRRIVGIDPGALKLVDRWLEERERLRIDARCPLFCTLTAPNRGRPMHTSAVRELLKDAARRAGIQKRVHPHGLRHTHAFELANEGVPIHLIQAQLGHTKLDITERYVSHLAPVAVVKAMQGRVWQLGEDGFHA